MRTKHTQHLSLVAVAVLVALLGVVSGFTLTISLNNGVAFADDIPNAYNSFTFTYKGDASVVQNLK